MKIFEFEEHSEVLSFWKEKNIQNANLIYFDQHFDLKKIRQDKLLKIEKADFNSLKYMLKDLPFRDNNDFYYGIDDFLYAATHLNMFKHIIWVYPSTELSNTMNLLNNTFFEHLSLVADHGEEIFNSFTKEFYGFSTKVNGTKFSITTIENLNNLLSVEDEEYLLDVDLDYFYSDISEDLIISLDLFVDTIIQNHHINQDVTFTYSIFSGYLNPKFRYIGKYLSQKLKADIKYSSYIHKSNYSFMQCVVRPSIASEELIGKIENSDFCEKYSGAAYSVLSNLNLLVGDISEAENNYEKAIAHNDFATFPAYKIGIYYMQKKNYEQSYNWFGKTQTDRIDTIQLRALYMQAISAFRLNRIENCIHLAFESIRITSLREEPLQLIGLISDLQQDNELKKKAIQGLEKINYLKQMI